jgi:hypothetical protein
VAVSDAAGRDVPTPAVWKIGYVPSWRPDVLNYASVIGLALIVSYVWHSLTQLATHPVDFSIFFASARSWVSGLPMYCGDCEAGLRLNYNPPHFHLLLLPLTLMPAGQAFLVWTAVSALAAAATVRLALDETGLCRNRASRTLVAAAVLTSAGTASVFMLGQVSWVVALPLALAWQRARRGRWASAGLWLGLALSVKPFLAFLVAMLLVRGRTKMVATAVGAAALWLAAGMLIFGVPAFEAWLGLLRRGAPAEHVGFFINGSWAGFVARTGMPAIVSILGAILIASVTLIAARQDGEDRAWLLGTLGALMISPLGWVYYLPFLFAPIVALAHDQTLPGWAWRMWPVFVFPPIGRDLFQSSSVMAASVGSLYWWLLLGLWIAALQAWPRVRTTVPESGTEPVLASTT